MTEIAVTAAKLGGEQKIQCPVQKVLSTTMCCLSEMVVEQFCVVVVVRKEVRDGRGLPWDLCGEDEAVEQFACRR